MKQKLIFPMETILLIRESMRFYRIKMNNREKPLFNIVYEKICLSNVIIELDGMEMYYVSRALYDYGEYLIKASDLIRGEICIKEGERIESVKRGFQMKQGPKVNYYG